ncbi:hypothetical protein TrVFT333_002240 [Trichoderma virens FT-333]|nr:hypothetical protein TrVFT333_002240 [Trichoderma virens FT-333]
MNDDDIPKLRSIFRATLTRHAEAEQTWRVQLERADEQHRLRPNAVLLRETQQRIRRECAANATNNIPLEEGPMLEMRNMLIKLLEDHDDKHSYASTALTGMITAGIVLRSREQESHDAKIASRLSLGLGLTGTVAGFFPAASPVVGLFVVLAGILVNNAADRHIRIHEAIEELALQWANASMLGSNDPQYAIIIQVAIIVLAVLDTSVYNLFH